MFERDELLNKILQDQKLLKKYILKEIKINIDDYLDENKVLKLKHASYLVLKRLEKKYGKKFSERTCCKVILSDRLYSPIATIVQEIRGKYYEKLLEEYLKSKGIKFIKGRKNKKEPDFILDNNLKINNVEINWIESKFFYADEKIHEYFKRKQYVYYSEKFGKGLILYWLGYDFNDNDFILKDYRFVSEEFPHITVYDIGYSDKRFSNFLKILNSKNINAIVDVRRFPTSKIKEYCRENLKKELEKVGIKYFWIEELGGFRTGGYEKYMYTYDFINGIIKLLKVIKKCLNVAIMCMEKNYKHCHRRYILNVIGDYFKVVHL